MTPTDGQFLEAARTARAFSKAHDLHKGGEGSFPCPVCGVGRITVIVVTIPSELQPVAQQWANCSTVGCVEFVFVEM